MNIKIAVTGGAGNIAYALLFRLASGEVFGPGYRIDLRILEIEPLVPKLSGLVMELKDCAFSALGSVSVGSDPNALFEDIDLALLIGAKPRGPGQERKDLLNENGKIFIEQGAALNRSAKPSAKVVVVGNPCNTNCLIALKNAPNLDERNFLAMTRLDQNRATGFLAEKASFPIKAVNDVFIWGNHSATQVPDFEHATIGGLPAKEVIDDEKWLKEDFVKGVQQRGAAVIKARGASSQGSAANALIDAVRSLYFPGSPFSAGVYTRGNPYGIDEDLIYSFPCVLENGSVRILEGYERSSWLDQKMKESEKELLEERNVVLSMK